MNVNLINDIINDYTKLYDELYKKKYSSLNDLLDKSKHDLNSLKEEILSIKEINLIKTDFLSEKNKNFILCIKHSLNNKLYKYIIDFLNILKKYIQYKLWTKNNSHETINLMKEISDYPKNGIECLNKVIEVLQTLLFTSFFDLNQNDIINIYLINIKVFNNTNNYQNSDFKNPIRLLFITLTDIVYKSNDSELITKLTKFIFSLYIKDDEGNNDNEYLELLKDFKNNIYIKCLSLELLSQGLKIIKLNQINNNQLDDFINKKIVSVVKENLNEIKKQQKNNDQQYIHLLKLCRISMILINNIIIDYDIIQSIISFLNEDIALLWFKNISMECLQDILNNSSLLINIYNHNKEILANIFSILDYIYEKMNNSESNLNQSNQLKNKKQIDKNNIFLQGDENSIIKSNESNDLINNIKQCLNNLINSFSSMMNEYKICMNKINLNLSKEQETIKEIVLMSSSNTKRIIFNLINKEFMSNDFDPSYFQKTINFIQNIIVLYSSLNLLDIRDEYLELICRLSKIFDNNKNLIICSSLLNLSKYISFYNEKSFVNIFYTIEKIHIKYNFNKNEKNKNVDLIIKDIFQSYQKFFTPNELENNINENNFQEIEFKNEKLEKQNLLCSAINTMFIDSKSMDGLSLKYIIAALFECLKIALNDEKEIEKKEKEEIVIFHLTKVLTITLLNIENIYILFDDYLIPIINLLIEKKILLNFTVNLICSIIKEILINHKIIIENIKQKTDNIDNNWWLNEKYQVKLFSILNSFTEHNLIELTKNRLYICITTIIQQSGNYIDLFGWESIFKICQILINYNIEEIFLIIKLILNDYNSYLTIFNVIPIITLLGTFISYQKDRNICFNSIELFWSCANIVEKYHTGKIIIEESQKKIFEELLKEQKIEKFDIFYNGLYYKIFSQLLRINSDFRNDIRRSSIKVFTEILVSKINSIDNENCFKIINDFFFNTFLLNSQKYIDNEKNKIIKEVEKNNLSNKENELEQTLHASLLSIIKILKSICCSEQNINNENIENIFIAFLKKLGEIILYGTIPLNTDILHGIYELKNAKNNNKLILPSHLDVYFEIIDKIKGYINSQRFKLSLYNKLKCIKFLNEIINTLNAIFCSELNYNFFSLPLNQIFTKIFEILDFLLNSNFSIENKSIESLPQRITEIENQIFSLIENIPNIKEQYIYNFIIIYINFDIKNYHSGALVKRAIDCLLNIINKNDNICFILNEIGKNYLLEIFEKLFFLFHSMNNETIIEKFINNEKKLEVIFIDFINLICKLFLGIIIKMEKNSEEILMKIINYSKMIYDKCINELKLISEEKYLNKIIEIYGKIIERIINFIFIDLLPFIYAILNKKNNEIHNIEKELLKMFCFEYNKDNKEKYISYKNINEIINKLFIERLFIICQYQTNEEILNYIKIKNSKNNIDEKLYINNFINFKKLCTILLIKKLNSILKEYKVEYENNNNKDLISKIIFIFSNIKNLEIFPNLANVKENENINQYKNRKLHIFYLYNNIIEFILIENKDIKLLIKDILFTAHNEIQLPTLQNISFEDK